MCNKIYFARILNDNTKEFTIIGGLSSEEDSTIVNKISEAIRAGIELQCDHIPTSISIDKYIKDFLECHKNYKLIPASEFLNKIGFNVNIE